MYSVLKFLVAGCLLAWSSAAPLYGQANLAPSTAAADEQPDASLSLGVSAGGMRRQVPGRWAILSVGGSNPTDRDREETMTVVIDGETNLQYARRMWLPAGARRVASLPIQIPEEVGLDQYQLDFSSMQIHHADDATETFQKDVVGMPSTPRTLLLSKEKSRAAIILDDAQVDDEVAHERNREIADTVNAARDAVIQSNRDIGLIHVQNQFLPASPVGLDAIDQIVIASDRILMDTLSLWRLQSWLQAGGRVWLMADRVSPEAARMLLGDAMCYSVVDRVELNEVEYATFDSSQLGSGRRLEKWSSEQPAELVRVFADDAEILCSVDNWPAAFRKRVGRGSVLFTTVEARAWTRDGIPLRTYANFASEFFSSREVVPQPTATWNVFVDDKIGYAIAHRSVIGMLLGLHLVIIIVAGVWLAKRENLQYLAVVIPIASLIVAGALILIGRQQTTAVPSMVAFSQVIRNLPNTPVVNLHSVASLYSQSERPLDLLSSPDSITLFNQEHPSSEVQRLQWDDSGRSRWLFVNQPPGVVRRVDTRSTVEPSPAWRVHGTFTNQGFEGRVDGLPTDRSHDAIVVAGPAPTLAIQFDPESEQRLTSRRDGVLSPGQFIDAAIVSDVQRERQGMLRQMLTPDAAPFGRDPILLAWTDPIDSGVRFDDDLELRGSALASIPIEWIPPRPGAEFHVPATFVRIEPYAGARGMTAIFNARTGQWLEMSQPRVTDLQCLMPREMLPCTVHRARVTIKISAPSRTFSVQSLVDGEPVTIYRKPNPSGLIRFDIVDPNVLTLNEQGGLVLSLAISPSEQERSQPPQPTNVVSGEIDFSGQTNSIGDANAAAANHPSRSTWKIDYIHVDFDATMQ